MLNCRDNLELVSQNCINRNSQANPKLIAELYGEYLQLNKEVNSIRQERNENAASMKVGVFNCQPDAKSGCTSTLQVKPYPLCTPYSSWAGCMIQEAAQPPLDTDFHHWHKEPLWKYGNLQKCQSSW